MREKRRQQRRKMRTLALSIIVIISLIATAIFLLPEKTEASEPVKIVTALVMPGDSLWKLAERYGHSCGMDTREYIRIIKEYNHLDSSTLQPGQQILIPVYSSGTESLPLTASLVR